MLNEEICTSDEVKWNIQASAGRARHFPRRSPCPVGSNKIIHRLNYSSIPRVKCVDHATHCSELTTADVN
jgi:hypothetical protein